MQPKNLDDLVAKSLENGASVAKVVAVKDIVTDGRTRLKCQFGCDSFGRNLMCPPHTPSHEVCLDILDKYSWAILFEFEIPGEELDMVLDVQREIQDFIETVEFEAMRIGYNFAFCLNASSCRICDRCIAWEGEDNLLCRHPRQARPSMDSFGIDVITTLKNIGYEETPRSLFALLLVD